MKTFDKNIILPYIKTPGDNGNNLTEETQYYLKLFENNINNNKKFKWNWCAGLFGGFWLLYRRMYGYAYITFLIWYILEKFIRTSTALQSSPKSLLIIYLVISLISILFLGFFGNALYLEHIKDRIKKVVPYEMGVDSRSVWLALMIPLLAY